jgi:hypothetical protein
MWSRSVALMNRGSDHRWFLWWFHHQMDAGNYRPVQGRRHDSVYHNMISMYGTDDIALRSLDHRLGTAVG